MASFHFPPLQEGRQVDPATRISFYGMQPEVLDVAQMTLNGSHVGLPNRRSTMTYLVREGDVSFDIEGHQVQAGPGDIVSVPPMHRRELRGTARMFVITDPPFDPADEGP